MMNTDINNSVAASFGSRLWNRMIPSLEWMAPAINTNPSTSSALANSDPRTAVWATVTSPARKANITTNSSVRLPSVA